MHEVKVKKVIFLTIITGIVLATLFVPFTASAAVVSSPHIKIAGEVWLLSNDGTRLFILPNTYYAKIDNLDETYYYVNFNGINGKVVKTQVSTVGYHEKALGTLRDLKISDSYSEFDGINLKATPDLSSVNIVSMPIKASFTFIGKYSTNEGLWYYVKYNQYLGYIKADRTTNPNISIENFVPVALTEDGIPNKEPTSSPKSVFEGLNANQDILKIIIIIGLTIPAILIIFLLFKPSKYNSSHY